MPLLSPSSLIAQVICPLTAFFFSLSDMSGPSATGPSDEQVINGTDDAPHIPPRSSSRVAASSKKERNSPRPREQVPAGNPESRTSSYPIPVTIERGSIDWGYMPRKRGSVMSIARSFSSTTTRSRPASNSSTYHPSASLSPLQAKGGDTEALKPLSEEDVVPGSFDLLAPVFDPGNRYCLEKRSEQLFSGEHLAVIFADPILLTRFTNFMQTTRPTSVSLLTYYFDILKALKAVGYSNAIAQSLVPVDGLRFTDHPAPPTENSILQEKANLAFEALVREELPAFITHTWIQTASLSIKRRIMDTLPAHLREMSEGLAEVFCLTDPSRDDNPIVFASEEFYRMTQYGVKHVIGRNCRLLQGPKTNPSSVARLRKNLTAGKEHYETVLNYRRDGSPFMNLLMCAPLVDSYGVTRYMIGAQIDVSGLVKECSGLESLRRLVSRESSAEEDAVLSSHSLKASDPNTDAFREMVELLDVSEMETVRRHGGEKHRFHEGIQHDEAISNWQKPRVIIQDDTSNAVDPDADTDLTNGRLAGIYENYLLVRPYPNLRILFASPSLRMPGILQSPFLSKIGGSDHVREELARAFEDGTVITAKIRWISKHDLDGRSRWIHCTPLVGSNGAIGVWMIVIVDDDDIHSRPRRSAPPVQTHLPSKTSSRTVRKIVPHDLMSLFSLKRSDPNISGTLFNGEVSDKETYINHDSMPNFI
ncbi:hypothetical protein B0H63DRAFT_244801 [Podospora didyma]|uniref:PAS domain-containing protein n=1 Tax=Podospora didyma TaxID=330526 RepID=A0AAE0KLI4_9PEZI|nr:hypothetical protein B0H63DRAFT_244801 [Podospora didyma]